LDQHVVDALSISSFESQ